MMYELERDLKKYHELADFIIENYCKCDFEKLAWVFEKIAELENEIERCKR